MTGPMTHFMEALLSNDVLTAKLRELGGEEMLASFRETAESFVTTETSSAVELELDDAALLAATNLAFDRNLIIDPQAADRLMPQCGGVTVDGVRKLRLKDEARAAVLRKAASSGALSSTLAETASADGEALSSAVGTDNDLASAWLRSLLRGKTPPIESLPVVQLRAAVEALRALEPAGDVVPNLPRAGEVERLLDHCELRQPLEILVGKRDDGDDRFAGREDEMTRLRSFVDVLTSHSRVEAVSRVFKRASRGLARTFGSGNALGLSVVARGGLGKSTLIAKFALDHFLNANAPLPFVYFDFDRASLQPRAPDQLAIEAMRQIALEFPQHAGELNRLTQRFRQHLVERDRAVAPAVGSLGVPAATGQPADLTSAGSLTDLRGEFSALMRNIAVSAGSRAFLIVFDTMEIVQSDPAAVSGIRSFIASLCKEPFHRLRVVMAGRAEIPEFTGISGLEMETKALKLEPFGVSDARVMADKLGRDLLGSEWRPEWTRLIAGAAKDPAERREPLTLRVCIEFIRAAAPKEREELVKDIGKLGERAGQDFVGRIYMRRMVEHIKGGDDVKAIAWPGLVARRLTRELLVDVIAPHCGLPPQRAAAAFDRLAKEVWVVLREGDVLIHRPDLRARTLPLMWQRDQSICETLAKALRDHHTEAGDLLESAYYRLLAGEHPDFLLTQCSADIVDRLAPAADDFAANWDSRMLPNAKLASAYLRSRKGPLMKQALFDKLPAEFGYAHLARAGAALRNLDDVKVHASLARHRGATVILERMSASDRVARQTVMIKTGQWAALDPHELIVPGNHNEATVLAFFVGRVGGGLLDPSDAERMSDMLLGAFPPDAMAHAWRIRAYLLPFLRHMRGDTFARCDLELASSLPISMDATPSYLAALRSAITVADKSFPALVQRWAQLTRATRLEGETLNRGEAMALNELMQSTTFGKFVSEHTESRSIRTVIEKFVTGSNEMHSRSRETTRAMSCLADWILVDPSNPLREGDGPLRSCFASRHADWIVPAGYIADAVASASDITGGIENFFGAQSASWGLPWIGGTAGTNYGDGIAIARRADEAGDLGGLLGLIGESAVGAELENIRVMDDALRRWRMSDLRAVA